MGKGREFFASQRYPNLRGRSLLVFSSVLLLISQLSFAEKRIWTSSGGSHKINAEFITVKNGHAVLKTEDGNTIEAPLGMLSQEDRQFVAGEVQKSRIANFIKEQLGENFELERFLSEKHTQDLKEFGGPDMYPVVSGFVSFRFGRAIDIKEVVSLSGDPEKVEKDQRLENQDSEQSQLSGERWHYGEKLNLFVSDGKIYEYRLDAKIMNSVIDKFAPKPTF